MVGGLLPLAVVVAISPVPIIAVTLMLLAEKAAGTSAGFLVGWVVGIAGATIASLFLVGSAEGTRLPASGVSGASWNH